MHLFKNHNKSYQPLTFKRLVYVCNMIILPVQWGIKKFQFAGPAFLQKLQWSEIFEIMSIYK